MNAADRDNRYVKSVEFAPGLLQPYRGLGAYGKRMDEWMLVMESKGNFGKGKKCKTSAASVLCIKMNMFSEY